MRIAARLSTLVAVAALVSGCSGAVPIGSELTLDYGGAHGDVVRACAREVPSTIRSPLGYPGSAAVSNVAVTSWQPSDAVTRIEVTGEIELAYGVDSLTYEWRCDASVRYGVLDVGDIDSELQGAAVGLGGAHPGSPSKIVCMPGGQLAVWD